MRYSIIEKQFTDGRHTREKVCTCRNLDTAINLAIYLDINCDIEDNKQGIVVYTNERVKK